MSARNFEILLCRGISFPQLHNLELEAQINTTPLKTTQYILMDITNKMKNYENYESAEIMKKVLKIYGQPKQKTSK